MSVSICLSLYVCLCMSVSVCLPFLIAVSVSLSLSHTHLCLYYRELRFLIHQSVVGGVIGKGGEKIKAIRAASGVNIKVDYLLEHLVRNFCVHLAHMMAGV